MIALVALLGYASDTPSLYGFAAEHEDGAADGPRAADACVGLLATQAGKRTDGVFRAALARRPDGHRLLPIVIVIPTILGLLGSRDEARPVRIGDRVLGGGRIDDRFVLRRDRGVRPRARSRGRSRREVAARSSANQQLNGSSSNAHSNDVGARGREPRARGVRVLARARSARAVASDRRLRRGARATHGDQLDAIGIELLSRMRRATRPDGQPDRRLLLLSELTRRRLAFEPVDLAEIAAEVAEELRAEDRAGTSRSRSSRGCT